MFLSQEEENILAGNEGEMLSKLMKLLVQLGESYGADKLIDIVSAHTVLNFGISFVKSAADILHSIAQEGLKVKVRTTTDPVIDHDFDDDLNVVYSVHELQDQLIEDLTKIGVKGFTCTPYMLDNRPNFG